MNTLVESLKRLYFQGKISSKKLNELLLDKKITKVEYKYIITE